MVSKSFGSQIPALAHLSKGEVADLRADVEAAFIVMEQQVEYPTSAQSQIRLNTNPTATDTITIGANVYEFVAALGSQTGLHIGVLIGLSAAASLANIIKAINGTGARDSVSSANGTELVKASVYNTDFLHIEPTSDVPGGTIVAGAGPALALSDGLTAAVAWTQTNLNKTGWAGLFKRAVVRIIVDATNLAADFDILLPFTPYLATCLVATSSAGVPSAAKTTNTTAGLTLAQARNAVTVDFDGPGGTDVVATDIVYLEVLGF